MPSGSPTRRPLPHNLLLYYPVFLGKNVEDDFYRLMLPQPLRYGGYDKVGCFFFRRSRNT